MAQWLTNPTRNHEVAGLISGLRIWRCRELWLWCRPVATALIRPLAWEPPYAAGVAPEKAKGKKKKKLGQFKHIYTYSFLLLLSFCHFLGHSHNTWRFPGQGSNRSCSHQPTPEPQQLGIQAASATYTTAHGNARSPTHWARPGTEPATSWFLVRFHCTTTGTPLSPLELSLKQLGTQTLTQVKNIIWMSYIMCY